MVNPLTAIAIPVFSKKTGDLPIQFFDCRPFAVKAIRLLTNFRGRPGGNGNKPPLSDSMHCSAYYAVRRASVRKQATLGREAAGKLLVAEG